MRFLGRRFNTSSTKDLGSSFVTIEKFYNEGMYFVISAFGMGGFFLAFNQRAVDDKIGGAMDIVNTKIGALEQKIEGVAAGVTRLERFEERVDEKLSHMDARLARMEDRMEERFRRIEQNLETLKKMMSKGR